MSNHLGPEELRKLEDLERIITSFRSDLGQPPESLGSRMADKVSTIVGSWKFLLGQAFVLCLYILGNVYLLHDLAKFDPYPFILLNLMLSFQAAFTAPIILMAQNRTDAKDRRASRKAYRTIGHMEELLSALANLEGIDPDQPSEPPSEAGSAESSEDQSS